MTISVMPGHLIRRLQQRSNQLFQETMKLANFEITSVQFAALNVLREKGDLEQAQIAKLIAYDKATIGGVIDRLKNKGWITRTTNPSDRRAKLVRITNDGKAQLEAMYPLVEKIQTDILQGLEKEEQQLFINLASKVVNKS